MINIEVGASRDTLLKFAADLWRTFNANGEHSFVLDGESNDDRGVPHVIRFSNEDMERPEVDDDVYIEVAES